MSRKIIALLHQIAVEYRSIAKVMMQLQHQRTVPAKRTSNKSQLKMKKKSPSVKYKSSKPITSSKGKQTFRNKSNLR